MIYVKGLKVENKLILFEEKLDEEKTRTTNHRATDLLLSVTQNLSSLSHFRFFSSPSCCLPAVVTNPALLWMIIQHEATYCARESAQWRKEILRKLHFVFNLNGYDSARLPEEKENLITVWESIEIGFYWVLGNESRRLSCQFGVDLSAFPRCVAVRGHKFQFTRRSGFWDAMRLSLTSRAMLTTLVVNHKLKYSKWLFNDTAERFIRLLWFLKCSFRREAECCATVVMKLLVDVL